MPEIVPIFVVALLATIFIRPSWLYWTVFMVGLLVVLGAAIISIASSSWRDLTPMYLWAGAWFWGMVIATFIRLIWMGAARVTFKSPNQLPWLNGLLSALWLAFAAGSIGYAFASNIAITYAENIEAAWILYDRSMAGAASGFFWLSIAALNAVSAFIKPALTQKGVRTGAGAIVEWKEFDSYEWQANKLIMYRKTKLFSRWSNDSQFAVNPAEQEAINRILAQHLPDKQVQPSAPIQAAT